MNPQSVEANWLRNVARKCDLTVDRKEEHKIDFRYQDCHMQLWKKQNISEFKSLYKGSKIILIGTHFKPI